MRCLIRASSIAFALLLAGTARASTLEADIEALNAELRNGARVGMPVSRVDRLVRQGADVNAPAPYGETALYYAIQFGRVKVALRLLELGADPNSVDDVDRTPLLKAAEDCDWRLVKALLKAGARVNHQDHAGRTALINAAEGGCVRATAVILTLARGKVRIDQMDGNYRTALEYARHPWIQQMLEVSGGGHATPNEAVNPLADPILRP
jgi:ankyrin repeat protein